MATGDRRTRFQGTRLGRLIARVGGPKTIALFAGEAVRQYLPLAGILALALAVRLFRLTWPGLWTEEGFSIFLARSPLPDLVVGTANDLHPPLFYALLKIWLLPGLSEAWARLFPLLWGLLTVGLLYHMGRRIFNPTVGAWAAFYLALSPVHVAYSREVRMYILLVFLATLSVYLAWRWVEDASPGAWVGYLAVTLMVVYTQNLGLLILPFENIWVILALLCRRRWRALPHWIAGQVLLLCGYLPWMPVVVYQVLFHHASWIGLGTLARLEPVLPHLAFGEPGWEQESAWRVTTYAYLLVLAGVSGVVYLVREVRRRWAGLWAWLWLLLPLATIFGLSLRFYIFQEKQFLLLSVPLALLLGLGTAGLRRRWRGAAAVLFLLLILPSLHNLYFRRERLADHVPAEEWGKLAAYMESHRQPGDALFLNPGAAVVMAALYLPAMPCEAYPQLYTPRVGNFTGQVATPELVEERLGPFARQHRRIWLVECCQPTYWDPQRYIPAWLESWGQPLEVPAFAGLEVRLYEARRPSPHFSPRPR